MITLIRVSNQLSGFSMFIFLLLRFLFIITLANINGKYGKEKHKKGRIDFILLEGKQKS